jgi:hypothetical protein
MISVEIQKLPNFYQLVLNSNYSKLMPKNYLERIIRLFKYRKYFWITLPYQDRGTINWHINGLEHLSTYVLCI